MVSTHYITPNSNEQHYDAQADSIDPCHLLSSDCASGRNVLINTVPAVKLHMNGHAGGAISYCEFWKRFMLRCAPPLRPQDIWSSCKILQEVPTYSPSSRFASGCAA